MNKNRILIFSLAYSPFIGGAEIAVQEITKRSPDFTWDLITANLDGKQKEKEQMGNVTVYRVGSKHLFPWLAFKKAKELHKENNYKIVWGVMASWGGWAALKFKEKFPKVKYLLTLQSGDSDAFIKSKTWFWHWRYRKIYTKADHVQVISQWLVERARKFGYQGKISLISNGVNIMKNKRIETDIKRILTVSRLVEKNGIEDLIRAFKLLFTNYGFEPEQVVLKIIGDGPLKSKLEKLVKKLDLKGNIFLGYRDYKNLPQYYAQADVFVRPSLSEGFGNVFIEAMAANVPVIGTKVGGIPDFLKEGETGWFCQVKNPDSIAEKIKYILDDKNKQEVNSVVMNAKKMVEEKYTWDKVASQMQKVFLELLK